MAVDEEVDARSFGDHRTTEREELLHVLSLGWHGAGLWFKYVVEAEFKAAPPINRGESFWGRRIRVKNGQHMRDFLDPLCTEIAKAAKRQLEGAHHRIPLHVAWKDATDRVATPWQFFVQISLMAPLVVRAAPHLIRWRGLIGSANRLFSDHCPKSIAGRFPFPHRIGPSRGRAPSAARRWN